MPNPVPSLPVCKSERIVRRGRVKPIAPRLTDVQIALISNDLLTTSGRKMINMNLLLDTLKNKIDTFECTTDPDVQKVMDIELLTLCQFVLELNNLIRKCISDRFYILNQTQEIMIFFKKFRTQCPLFWKHCDFDGPVLNAALVSVCGQAVFGPE